MKEMEELLVKASWFEMVSALRLDLYKSNASLEQAKREIEALKGRLSESGSSTQIQEEKLHDHSA